MLGIILMILKWIGWLLLGIFGFLIFLLLLVLFLPVSYRVWVNGDTTEPDQLSYCVKILGIQILPKKERRWLQKLHREKKTPDKDVSPDLPKEEPTAVLPVQPEDSSEENREERSPDASADSGKRSACPGKEKKEKRKKTAKKNNKESSGKDIRLLFDQFQRELKDEGNHRAVRHVFSEVRYLVSHFGPRKVQADVCFSLGDPSSTGYVTAVLSVCPFSYGKNTRILPDFETDQFYLKGWLDVKGHVRAVHLLVSGLRLLFDRDIRMIIKKVLKKK